MGSRFSTQSNPKTLKWCRWQAARISDTKVDPIVTQWGGLVPFLVGFTEEEGKFSSASWETQALEIQPHLQSEGRHGPIPRKPPLEGDRDLFLDSPSLKETAIARCSGSSRLKETHSHTPVFREFLLDKQMLCIPCFLFPGHFSCQHFSPLF